MPHLLRALATISLFPLAAIAVLTIRSATSSRASAGEFQPIKEAEMPVGFPDYTPVGQIEVKQYPTYRTAAASGAAAFWTLFRHIQENKVKMTAPVEMDYGDPRDEKSQRHSMAFLYETPDQ
jgi:hypothetical protein